MISQRDSGAALPSFSLILLGVAAACAISFAAVHDHSDKSSRSTESTQSFLPPSIPVAVSEAERQAAETQFDEDQTTNVFGPMEFTATPLPQRSVDEQAADAIAELENGLAALGLE